MRLQLQHSRITKVIDELEAKASSILVEKFKRSSWIRVRSGNYLFELVTSDEISLIYECCVLLRYEGRIQSR